jgi:hypothetical protein
LDIPLECGGLVHLNKPSRAVVLIDCKSDEMQCLMSI